MRTVFAFILGTVVGMVVALLFAPTSGTELRSQISEEAALERQRMQEGYHRATEKTHDRLDKMQADVQSLLKHQEEQAEAVAAEAEEEPAAVEEEAEPAEA